MTAIGSDHAGFRYKERIKPLLESLGIPFTDFGTFSDASTDYPDWAVQVATAVAEGRCERGILVCGTGIGVSITANKVQGIRAAVCESAKSAELSRRHNDANVLCFGERIVTWETAEAIIRTFLATPFEGGRHASRIEKIHGLTNC